MLDLVPFSRLHLYPYPTPLEEMVRLREVLGCKPRLFVKRDDLTGVGLGGNKVRKLDFLLAQAKEKKAQAVITCGGLQSNHCRQTAALAAQLGLASHLVLQGEEPSQYQGNLLLFHLYGATLHFIGPEGDMEEEMERVAAEVRREGQIPYTIPLGGSNPLGTLGYVESGLEAFRQAEALGVPLDHAFVASGSGGTQAGLIMAGEEVLPGLQVHGISVGRRASIQRERVSQLVNSTYDLLGLHRRIEPQEISIFDSFYGEGYGLPTREGIDAIHLMAREEGILLDPVYTGKALHGMLTLLREEPLSQSSGLLFFHTGGHPALFAYANEI